MVKCTPALGFLFFITWAVQSSVAQSKENCTGAKADLYFVLDASGSVGTNDFQMSLDFLKKIVKSMTIGLNDVRVGMITYASIVNVNFHLTDYATEAGLLNAISNIRYTSGGTQTGMALNTLNKELLPKARRDVIQVAIILTDGHSNGGLNGQAVQNARKLKDSGVIIITVGITDNSNKPELNAMASGTKYVFYKETLNNLHDIIGDITKKMCLETNCTSEKIHIQQQDFQRSGDNSSYVYWILGGSNMTTLVQFINFRLSTCNYCDCERLTIYHGNFSEDGHMVGQYCGSDLPPPLSYKGPISMQLKTNRWIPRSDLLLQYEIQGCGGVYPYLEGDIKSPDYPAPYSNCSDCTYIIPGQPGGTTSIRFVEFSLGECNRSKLTIYYGNTIHSALQVGVYCGKNGPPEIKYSGPITIAFRSSEIPLVNRFRFQYKVTGCNEVYNSSMGTITWSNNRALNDSHRMDCKFVISTHSNMYILVQFQYFNLKADYNCHESRMSVYQGNGTQDDNLVRTYCGNSIPQNINYKGPITLRIQTKKHEMINETFLANYTMYQCGGTFNEANHFNYWDNYYYGHPSHIIESPNFPNGYYSNLDCEYIINPSRRAGSQITVIEFKNFSLEYDFMCNKDSLTIYGKTTDGTTMLGKYCGRRLPPVIAHKGSVILRFRTSTAEQRPGFRLIYRFKDCGGNINPSPLVQRITLNNQTDYKNVECTYQISGGNSTQTMIRFLDINLNNDQACRRDSLTIYGSPKTNQSNVIGKYCGNTLPPDSKYWGEMAVKLKTNRYSTKVEFDFLVFTCSQRFSVSTDYRAFDTPYYNGLYLSDLDCEYTFHGARSIDIHMSFYGENSKDCNKDNVTIYRGNSSVSGFLVGTYCGQNTPSVLISAEPITIRLRTDSSGVNSGSYIQYKGSECGGIYSESEGILEYYNKYSFSCEYIIIGNSKLATVLKFTSVSNYGCNYANVTIFYGNNSQTGQHVGTYCGGNLPPLIVHVGPITVLCQSGYSYYASRVITHVKFQYKLQDCGGRYDDLNGSIRLPNYPNSYQSDCEYIVLGRANMKTAIRIATMSQQNFQLMCRMRYLRIYSVETGQEISTHCWHNQPDLITYHGPLKLLFKANNRMTHRVYTLLYEVTECGGTYKGLTGTLKSPNNPYSYSNNLTCDYVILGDSDRPITIRAIEFKLQQSNGCYLDSLSIYRGYPSNGTLIGKYCGKLGPVLSNIRGPLTLRFHADRSITNHGFQLHYTVHTCSTLYNSTNGTISSPNFPKSSLDCEYKIPGHADRVTFINFTAFRLEECNDCQCDNLTIYQGSSSAQMIGRFCGHVSIPMQIFTGPITMRFRSNHLIENSGFQLRYEVKACNAFYQQKKGVVMSPNHPLNYANNLNCTYYIKGNTNHAIVLRFLEFKLKNSYNCQKDSFAVYAGIGTQASNLIGRYCGNVIPKDIITYGPATLQLVTDGYGTGQGFLVEYSVEKY